MHNTTTTTPSAIVIEHPAASVSSSSSAQAFALVLMAAAATGLGASVVFCPALARFATKKVLAVTLGFAAGVMLYVSLVDIYGKSINGFASSFQDDDDDNSKAFIYASLTFFGGILLMKVRLSFIVFRLPFIVPCLLACRAYECYSTLFWRAKRN